MFICQSQIQEGGVYITEPHLFSNFTWKYNNFKYCISKLPLTPTCSALYYFNSEHVRTSLELRSTKGNNCCW